MTSANVTVLPAYAGMIRWISLGCKWGRSAPRVCGDDPGDLVAVSGQLACSPRMRG